MYDIPNSISLTNSSPCHSCILNTLLMYKKTFVVFCSFSLRYKLLPFFLLSHHDTSPPSSLPSRLATGHGAPPQRHGRRHHQQPEPRAAEGDARLDRELLLRRFQHRGRRPVQSHTPQGQVYVSLCCLCACLCASVSHFFKCNVKCWFKLIVKMGTVFLSPGRGKVSVYQRGSVQLVNTKASELVNIHFSLGLWKKKNVARFQC